MKTDCPLCHARTLERPWHYWPIAFLRSLATAKRNGIYPPKP
jgi:hypothetical protein